jgi:type III pantothenate kinase
MILAIDVGNTHTVYGLWDGSRWVETWRRSTQSEDTEDQLAAWLHSMFELRAIPFQVDAAIAASVVPTLNAALESMCDKHLGIPLCVLRTGAQIGLKVTYSPPEAVGADRLANALGALLNYDPPLVVVDLGTATTFDVIDGAGTYLGGAILPGIAISAEALVRRTAKLPPIEFRKPERAVGKTTVEALQSGMVLGYAGAIDRISSEIVAELGGDARVIATGGLGGLFLGIASSLQVYEPNLTLDGLVEAHRRLS